MRCLVRGMRGLWWEAVGDVTGLMIRRLPGCFMGSNEVDERCVHACMDTMRRSDGDVLDGPLIVFFSYSSSSPVATTRRECP